MSPTPDKSTKLATLHFGIDLPANYEELSADQQRVVRRAYKTAIARHPDETDDQLGDALGKLQRGEHPTVTGPAWKDADLVAKSGYPTQAELRAFVAERLAGYNAAILGPRGEDHVELVPEDQDPADSGAGSSGSSGSSGSGTVDPASAPTSDPTTDPGTVSDPHDGPGGPRHVRYRIVNGELVCFYGYNVQKKGAPARRPWKLQVDAGQALEIPIYAEVGFTRQANA